MNKLIVIAFLMLTLQMNAQKNIDGLIHAEKSFAAFSVAHGTKDAFLKFLDSNGVVFNQGKAVNGMETWTKREKRPGILNWQPQFAEISCSNDFGYTTGPWTFQPKTTDDSITASGQYTTVWHVNANGDWKFLVDLGSGNTTKASSLAVSKINSKKIAGKASTDDVIADEKNFIALYKEDKTKAYQKYLSAESILNRNGNSGVTNKKDQNLLIVSTPSSLEFTVDGSGIAASGDLAYVYGTVTTDNKSENYLRIWRKEKEGWRIALEVLRY